MTRGFACLKVSRRPAAGCFLQGIVYHKKQGASIGFLQIFRRAASPWKLSSLGPLTDEGQTCRYDPYTGCAASSPLIRPCGATFPTQGKAGALLHPAPDQTNFCNHHPAVPARRSMARQASERLCIWLPTAPRRPHRRGRSSTPRRVRRVVSGNRGGHSCRKSQPVLQIALRSGRSGGRLLAYFCAIAP